MFEVTIEETFAAGHALRNYRGKCENDDPQAVNYGMIAEEVAEVDPQLVSYDDKGEPLAVQYERLALLLLPLVQELLGMDEPEGVY